MISGRALERVGRWRAGPVNGGQCQSRSSASSTTCTRAERTQQLKNPNEPSGSERTRQRERTLERTKPAGANGFAAPMDPPAARSKRTRERRVQTNPAERESKPTRRSERTQRDRPTSGGIETSQRRANPNEPSRAASKRTRPNGVASRPALPCAPPEVVGIAFRSACARGSRRTAGSISIARSPPSIPGGMLAPSPQLRQTTPPDLWFSTDVEGGCTRYRSVLVCTCPCTWRVRLEI
jgi:hypothetical protein